MKKEIMGKTQVNGSTCTRKKVGTALSIVGLVFLIAPLALYFIMGESIPVILGGSSGTAQLMIIVALIPAPAISLGLGTFLLTEDSDYYPYPLLYGVGVAAIVAFIMFFGLAVTIPSFVQTGKL